MSGHRYLLAISDRAAHQLADIWAYGVEQWDERQADRYHTRILEIFGLLTRNPDIGVSRHEYGEAIRTFPVERHIIVYRPSDEVVTILAVVSSGSNFRSERDSAL